MPRPTCSLALKTAGASSLRSLRARCTLSFYTTPLPSIHTLYTETLLHSPPLPTTRLSLLLLCLPTYLIIALNTALLPCCSPPRAIEPASPPPPDRAFREQRACLAVRLFGRTFHSTSRSLATGHLAHCLHLLSTPRSLPTLHLRRTSNFSSSAPDVRRSYRVRRSSDRSAPAAPRPLTTVRSSSSASQARHTLRLSTTQSPFHPSTTSPLGPILL